MSANYGTMSAMKKASVTKILVALRLSHASWRDFLTGFLGAMRAFPHWSLRIIEPSDLARALEASVPDGLVIGDVDDEAAARLMRETLPTVAVGSQSTVLVDRTRNIVFLHNDDEGIGRAGAQFLAALGTRSCYGFVPHPDGTHWSALRRKGFASEMKTLGKSVAVYRPPCAADTQTDQRRLLRWLQALPKPAAVMAAYDAIAVRIVETCTGAGLDVPTQVAVIGVDNDPLLCESARPSLTSLAPDHVHEGELAADALASLLRRRTSRPKTILCTRKKFVVRESTKPTKPAAVLLRRALAFIDENAASKITSADVARHLGVSRQLVELRFREFGERTLAATIREARLKEVRRRLRLTSQSIRTVAESCGWANVNHLENVFKRRFGISIGAARHSFTRKS